MTSLRDPARWPMSWWYTVAAVQAAVFGALAGGVYWLAHGEFWETFAYGFAGALAAGLFGLWRPRKARRSSTQIDSREA